MLLLAMRSFLLRSEKNSIAKLNPPEFCGLFHVTAIVAIRGFLNDATAPVDDTLYNKLQIPSQEIQLRVPTCRTSISPKSKATEPQNPPPDVPQLPSIPTWACGADKMQARRDEILAKKAKLAELKRQRELRSTSSTRQSIGGAADVDSPCHVQYSGTDRL